MFPPLAISGIAVDNVETLFTNVISKAFNLPAIVVAFDQTQVEDGCSRGGDNVASEGADISTAHAVDIQARQIDQLEQALTRAFGARQPQLSSKLVVILRRFSNRAPLRFTEWLDVVIPSGDCYPP